MACWCSLLIVVKMSKERFLHPERSGNIILKEFGTWPFKQICGAPLSHLSGWAKPGHTRCHRFLCGWWGIQGGKD